MLDEYDGWSAEISEEIERNHRYLEVVQLSLSFGVVALLFSSITILVVFAYEISPLITFGVVLAIAALLTTPTCLRDNDEPFS